MPMSLLRLHAAIFSILIATLDSIECMLVLVFFLGTLGFLGTPLRERFAGTSLRICDCRLSSLGHVTFGTLSLHCLYLVSMSTHTS